MKQIIVPYNERETVEKLGATKSKTPYYLVPSDKKTQDFSRWNRQPLNLKIEGEDRTFGKNQLYVDLIPSSSWYKNTREFVDDVDWERIKELCKKRAKNKCELCGSSPNFRDNLYMECHERFLYNIDTKTQSLIRLLCVCTKCHLVTHFGFSQIQGKDDEAREHLMRINRWDKERADKHIEYRFSQWREKSNMPWELDLSMLKGMDLPSLNAND